MKWQHIIVLISPLEVDIRTFKNILKVQLMAIDSGEHSEFHLYISGG
jgi:hypothetical protein